METNSVVYYWDTEYLYLVQILEWSKYDDGFYITKFKYMTSDKKGQVDTVDDCNPDPFSEYFYQYKEDVVRYFDLPDYLEQKGEQRKVSNARFNLGEWAYYKGEQDITYGKIVSLEFTLDNGDYAIFESMDQVPLEDVYSSISDLFVGLLS